MSKLRFRDLLDARENNTVPSKDFRKEVREVIAEERELELGQTAKEEVHKQPHVQPAIQKSELNIDIAWRKVRAFSLGLAIASSIFVLTSMLLIVLSFAGFR